jgi:hypothetical protein
MEVQNQRLWRGVDELARMRLGVAQINGHAHLGVVGGALEGSTGSLSSPHAMRGEEAGASQD